MPRKGNRSKAKNKINWDPEGILQIEQPYNPEEKPEWLVELRKIIGFVENENTLNDVEIETRLMIQKFAK